MYVTSSDETLEIIVFIAAIISIGITIFFMYHVAIISRRIRYLVEMFEERSILDEVFLFPEEVICPCCETGWELPPRHRVRPRFTCKECKTVIEAESYGQEAPFD